MQPEKEKQTYCHAYTMVIAVRSLYSSRDKREAGGVQDLHS